MRHLTNYNDFREIVDDGDIVFVGGPGSVIGKMIQSVTGSPWFHVGFAFRDGFRVMYAEAFPPERRIITLSAYSGQILGRVPAPWPWDRLKDSVMRRTGIEAYGYRDLLRIAIREKTGINLGDPAGEVCSEMVAKELKRGGYPGNLTTIPSPERLRVELQGFGHAITDICNR